MGKIKLEKTFFDLFPEARIGLIYAEGIENSIKEEGKYLSLIESAQAATIEKYLTKEVFTDNEVIGVWRDAYQKFKTKKGARVSIENLLKRVKNGNPVGSINPLVDLYNYISIKYAFPIGGDDHESIAGDVSFRVAEGGESFMAIGSDKEEPALEGELIFADGEGAICRCWNWRQTQRTMITESTTKSLLVVENCNSNRIEDQDAATQELAKLLEDELGAKVKIAILDINNPEFIIE